MNTITTSIFVPAKTKNEMTLSAASDLDNKLNGARYLSSDDLGIGALDDLKEGDEFVLVVNGEHGKHEIKLRGTNSVTGKLRLIAVEPKKPEVQRFLMWRIPRQHLVSRNRGTELQLGRYTITDLRLLIRQAFARRERSLVNYR